MADPPPAPGSPPDRFERLANLLTFLLDAGERGGPGVSYGDIVGSIPGYPEGDEARRRAFDSSKARSS